MRRPLGGRSRFRLGTGLFFGEKRCLPHARRENRDRCPPLNGPL